MSTRAPGGIRSVVKNMIDSGMYDDPELKYHWHHSHDNSAVSHILLFLKALLFVVTSRDKKCRNILHLHTSQRGSIYRKLLLATTGKVLKYHIVVHLHGSEFEREYQARTSIYRLSVRLLLNRADGIAVLGENMSALIEKLTDTPLYIMRNFLPEHSLTRFKESNNSQPDNHGKDRFPPQRPFTILFLGAVGERKGIPEVLKAIALLVKRNRNVRLKIGGDGAIANYQKMCDELGISEFIYFAGWVTGDQKYSMFFESDVLVLPSLAEGFPVTLVECLAYEIPFITTSVGGIPDLIQHDLNGLLIEPKNENQLADELEKLIKSPALRRRLVSNGKQTFKAHLTQQIAKQSLNRIYSSAI